MHHEAGGKVWIGFYCLSKIQHMDLVNCCDRECGDVHLLLRYCCKYILAVFILFDG